MISQGTVGLVLAGVGVALFILLALMRRGTGRLAPDYGPAVPVGGLGAGLIDNAGALRTIGYGLLSAVSFPVLMFVGGYPRQRRETK